MITVPLQTFGIGDVIFSVKLIRELAEGNKILWPVESEFVEGLSRAYPDILFIDKQYTNIDFGIKEDKNIGDMRIIPIRWSYVIMKVPYTQCMSSKYEMYGKDFRLWWAAASPIWDHQKGQRLYEQLGLQPGEPYNLINNTFRSDFEGNAGIKVDNGHRNIEMTPTPGFSLFDWHLVLKNAKEIHTISTSLLYLLELLPLEQPLHLYPRPEDPEYKNVEYLFTRPYVLHFKDGSVRHTRPR